MEKQNANAYRYWFLGRLYGHQFDTVLAWGNNRKEIKDLAREATALEIAYVQDRDTLQIIYKRN